MNPELTELSLAQEALLDRYFAGTATAEDLVAARELLAAQPGLELLVEEVRAPRAIPNRPAPEVAFAELRGRMGSDERSANGNRTLLSSGNLPRSTPQASRSGFNLIGLAGAVSLAVIGVFALKYLGTSDTKPSAQPSSTYVTRAGERATITLGDGSRITLGPGTTLRVAQPSDHSLAVNLDGEALFVVTQATRRPFVVTAHGATTRVLGTEFVVRAYDPSRIRVAVRTGRVSVQAPPVLPAAAVTVGSGQATTITQNESPVVRPIEDVATDFAWASGELVLQDVPVGEALVRLSRWYGLEFRTDDPTLMDERIEATFSATLDMPYLTGVAKVLGARVVRSGSVVTLSRVR